MSDTIRSYSKSRPVSVSQRRSPWTRVRIALAALLLLVIGYGCWMTRDNVAPERLIPARQKYDVTVMDLLGKRNKIAHAPVWQIVPKTMALARIPDALTHTLGLPDWLFNNLIGKRCYLSGNDLREFRDAVFITKMRPVGAVLERLYWLAPGIETDPAGGLNLRRLVKANVYYAVRGRVLVVSRSRDALIRALSLRLQDSLLAARRPDRPAAESNAEDVRGSVTLAPNDPLGAMFTTIRFALKIATPDTVFKCSGALTSKARQRFSAVLKHASPQELGVPPAGLIEVSANFGQSVHGLLTGLGDACRYAPLSNAAWKRYETAPEDGNDVPHELGRIIQTLTRTVGLAGPAFRLSACGVDLNEIVPVPELVGVFASPGQSLASIAQALPAPPPGSQPWETFARYNPKTRTLVVPPPAGGPSLEITAKNWGDDLLVSSSLPVATRLSAQPPLHALLPQKGNLFIRVRPSPCVKAITNAAQMLVQYGALRGYTPESFKQAAAQWQQRADVLQQAWALASYQHGKITVTVDLNCAPTDD